jgi:hypothetical protein
LKPIGDYQEAEIWSGVEEALHLAQSGQFVPAGAQFDSIVLHALKKSEADSRPSAEVRLVVGDERRSIVVAVSKNDAGQAFAHWFNALQESMGGNVAGAVVIRPRAQLRVGPNTKSFKEYQARLQSHAIRSFALDENVDTFVRLESLRQLIRKARAGDFVLNQRPIGVDECRRLLVVTNVLADLKLFEILFHNWAVMEPAATAVAIPP